MIFAGVNKVGNLVTVDGYSDKKTDLGAIRDIGRYIEKHVDQGEGENIVKYGIESLLKASDSCGGYFLEIEEVPCASEWDEEKQEMKYKDANYYVVCRIVKGE